ncbi:transposase [mine drainage metagenome]|uniref:Transposase n=1 Tax=mine drainage metagenome TaxID=410659 RepID=A0A1J5QAG3_9ZZZZ
MAPRHSDEFKRDAVRIAQTSGLTMRQVSSDLGIGLSTLGKWVQAIAEEAKVPAQDAELLRENERLRKENRILREEREVLKKRRCSSRLKSREVSIHCRLSWQSDAQPPVPPDGCDRARALCLEAPTAVTSPAA